jgi:hypothetical protein
VKRLLAVAGSGAACNRRRKSGPWSGHLLKHPAPLRIAMAQRASPDARRDWGAAEARTRRSGMTVSFGIPNTRCLRLCSALKEADIEAASERQPPVV